MLPATKEIQPDWDLSVPVFHVTARGEEPAIQTQVREMTPGPGGWGWSGDGRRPRRGQSRVRKTPPELISEMGKD